jgi:hypothetical protein
MKKNIMLINILIIFLNLYSLMANENEPSRSVCMINNFKYSSEYLIASPFDSGLYTEKGSIFQNRKVYDAKLDHNSITSYKQALWILEPNSKNSSQFYLINFQYKDEYMCSFQKHLDIFNNRRKIGLIRKTSNNDDTFVLTEKCLWDFERMKKMTSDKNLNIISNCEYRESLYAASDLFKSTKSKQRNVYTWGKRPDSNQFVWNLLCLKNEELSEMSGTSLKKLLRLKQ